MAFWGIEIKPGKPYTHQYDDERGRLHVSQATLGTGLSKEKAVLVCEIGDKKPVYLCSLLPNRMETCPLNIEFEEYDEVTFSVVGPYSIHLAGFFHGESQETNGDDYESDSYEDGSFEAGSDSDYETDDDEDDFIENDFDMFPPSPVANSGVIIEEIVDDEKKPANESGMSKQPNKKNHRLSGSDDNDNSRQIVLKNASSVPILESEDEDGFPISSPARSRADVLSSKENAENGKGGQAKRKKAKDDSGRIKSAKRKKEDIVKDGDPARGTSERLNLLAPTPEGVPDNDVKKAKKNKNKKVREREKKMQEAGSGCKSAIQPDEVNNQKQTGEKGLDAYADSVAGKSQSKETNTKKNKKKSKQQDNVAGTNVELNVTTNEIGEKAEAKPFQARSFLNGLVIEELEMGKPDGKRASPGKKVSVHYIGKLKKNGKIFDSNIGRAPFKFRLGVGEVIKGWDVGVNGMRVGDKRRLTIPPAMGYGARGAGGAIPPNSWLVFDLELVGAS